MRGIFSAGVMDAMMDSGIKFDGAIGVSAGACFGCNYKSHQPGRALRYNKRYARDSRYCSWWSLIKTGDLYGADFCYRELPDRLDPFDKAEYEANPMEFYTVTTDCATGKPVYKRLDKADHETFDWIRASSSMPLVSRPVFLNGTYHLDGGLSDGIPLKYFESIGYERNIVITTRPKDYRKHPSSKIKLFRPLLKKYPAVYEALANRHVWYNQTLDYIDSRVKAGAAFLICPESPLPISRLCHDPNMLQQVYDIGHSTCIKYMDRIMEFLG